MNSLRPSLRVVAFAGVAGGVLTAIPLALGSLARNSSPIREVLAWPGMTISGLLGANDKWGLPSLPPYLIAGTLSWAGVILLVSFVGAFVRAREASNR